MAKSTEWLKDTVRGKIINLENPGKNIEVGVNGVALFYADSVICDVPKAVISCIEDAITYKYDQNLHNLDSGEERKKVPVALFRFYPENGPEKIVSKKREKIEDAKKSIEEVVDDVPTPVFEDDVTEENMADIHALREA